MIEAAAPTPVIVLSRFAEWGPYLTALKAGAFDYLVCPPDGAEVDRILSCGRRAWRARTGQYRSGLPN